MICYLLEISLILWRQLPAPFLPFIYLFCFILRCSRLALCLTDCLNCFAPQPPSPAVRVFILLFVCLSVCVFSCVCICFCICLWQFSAMFSLHLLLATRQIVLKIEISQIGQSGCGV